MGQQVLTAGYETLSGATFNASTSIITFGTAPPPAQAQTTLALIYPTGVGTGSVGTIWSRNNAGVTDLQSLFLLEQTGSPFVGWDSTSGSANGRPNRVAATQISYNNWWHVGAAWSGTSLATNIATYQGKNGAPVVGQLSYSVSNDGSGSGNDAASYSFCIGARTNSASTFKGVISYVARWNRVLTLAELQQAQRIGPLSCPTGLILFWVNDRDFSPYALQPTSRVALGAGIVPPPFNQRLNLRPFRKLWVTGGSRAVASKWFFGA